MVLLYSVEDRLTPQALFFTKFNEISICVKGAATWQYGWFM